MLDNESFLNILINKKKKYLKKESFHFEAIISKGRSHFTDKMNVP